MRQRILWYVGGAIALGFLQKLLFDRLLIFGAKPDALLLLTVWIARREGQSLGITAGFFIGLFMDLLHGTMGLDSFAKTVSGFVAGFFANPDDLDKASNFILATALAALFGTSAYELVSTALQAPLFKWTLLAIATSLYNLPFAYLFFEGAKRFT
ncbi:MAG: rod shape-determining protein MreD [Chloroherpetonaceae bacterium]